MGDRANIKVLQGHGKDSVYLYTHWGGTELARTLRTALTRKQRWNDEAYLARIIFCEMVKGAEADETGFGIATSPPDNGHQILTVDCEKRYVRIGPQDEEPTHNIPFATYIKMTLEEVDAMYLEKEDPSPR